MNVQPTRGKILEGGKLGICSFVVKEEGGGKDHEKTPPIRERWKGGAPKPGSFFPHRKGKLGER